MRTSKVSACAFAPAPLTPRSFCCFFPLSSTSIPLFYLSASYLIPSCRFTASPLSTLISHSLCLTLFHQRCSCVLRVLISQRSCTFIFLYVKSTATMLHRLTCKFIAGHCPHPIPSASSGSLLSSCAKTHLQLPLLKFIRLASGRIKRRLDHCHLLPSPPPDHRRCLESFQIRRLLAQQHNVMAFTFTSGAIKCF